jgi:hypothetical protein
MLLIDRRMRAGKSKTRKVWEKKVMVGILRIYALVAVTPNLCTP